MTLPPKMIHLPAHFFLLHKTANTAKSPNYSNNFISEWSQLLWTQM